MSKELSSKIQVGDVLIYQGMIYDVSYINRNGFDNHNYTAVDAVRNGTDTRFYVYDDHILSGQIKVYRKIKNDIKITKTFLNHYTASVDDVILRTPTGRVKKFSSKELAEKAVLAYTKSVMKLKV